jgi:hypothetical protein
MSYRFWLAHPVRNEKDLVESYTHSGHEKEYLKAMLHPQKTWGWTGMAAIRGKGSLDAHFYLSHSSLQPVAFQPIDRLKSDTHG